MDPIGRGTTENHWNPNAQRFIRHRHSFGFTTFSYTFIFPVPIYLVHQGPSRVPLPDMLACLGARGYKYIRVGNWKIRVYFFSDVFVMFFETCTIMSAKSNHGSLEPSNRRHSDEINLGWIVRYVNSEVTPKGSWLKGIHPAFYGHLRDW